MTITADPITRPLPQPLAPTAPVSAPKLELIGATVGRTAAVQRAYIASRAVASDGCPFCDAANGGERPVLWHDTMLVLANRFPYAVWDSALVEDHLMVVPARHTLSLKDFTDDEMADFVALTTQYESDGYSVYTRSQGNKGRSVGHLHTHLIKTGDFYVA